MSSASESAKDATLKISSSDVWEILKITWKETAVVTRYGSNQSQGFGKSISGRRDGDLTIEGKFDTGAVSPLLYTDENSNTSLSGASVTVQNYFDGTHYWNIPAVVEDFEVEEDIDTGAPISFKATLKNNGKWTEPTFA